MYRCFIVLLILIISELSSYATDLYCNFTERNADYNTVLGSGIINYNNVLFSIDDNTKTITYSNRKTPLEVISYTKELLKFKLNISTENSENDYIITINRISGKIKTEHHRTIETKTYNPLSQYLKDSPKYETYTTETNFYGNGVCSKSMKSITPKF